MASLTNDELIPVLKGMPDDTKLRVSVDPGTFREYSLGDICGRMISNAYGIETVDGVHLYSKTHYDARDSSKDRWQKGFHLTYFLPIGYPGEKPEADGRDHHQWLKAQWDTRVKVEV
jgi:hypothetical protein